MFYIQTKANQWYHHLCTKDNFRPVNYFCHLNEQQYFDEATMGVAVLKEFIRDIPHPLLFIEKRDHVKPFNIIKGPNIKRFIYCIIII